jgi:phosphoglycolate phosphatase
MHTTPDADMICAAQALKLYVNDSGDECLIDFDGFTLTGSAKSAADYFGIVSSSDYEDNDELYKIEFDEDFLMDFSSYSVTVYKSLREDKIFTDKMLEAVFIGFYCSSNALRECAHPFELDISDFGARYAEAAEAIYQTDVESFYKGGIWNKMGKILSNSENFTTPTKALVTLFKAENVTPADISIINDTVFSVGACDVSLVWVQNGENIIISARSDVREIMADEILSFLTGGCGRIRGSIHSASCTLSLQKFTKVLTHEFDVITPEIYIRKKCSDYVSDCDLVFCGERGARFAQIQNEQLKFTSEMDFSEMGKYIKTPIPLGFCRTTDFYVAGTPLVIRTLEGDIETLSADDTYLMIGVDGEIYPIKTERFRATYKELEGVYDIESEYSAVIINRNSGERMEVKKYARLCMPSGGKVIRAKKLTRYTKVFTDWDKERYFFGIPGDMLACGESEHDDCYIIRADIFLKTYEDKFSSGIGKLYGLINSYEAAAFVDKLTGLQNRNAYLARVDSYCTAANMPLGIADGDVNFLKLINDTRGHNAGDRLLQIVSEEILNVVPYGTFVARTGGDELVLLFPGGGQRAADRFIENINAALAVIHDDIVGNPSVSWGSAELTSPAASYEEAFNLADERMYEDKKKRKAERKV